MNHSRDDQGSLSIPRPEKRALANGSQPGTRQIWVFQPMPPTIILAGPESQTR